MAETRFCIICSVAFQPRPSRPNQKFCSLQCAGRGKVVQPPTLTCSNCGKIVERRRFRMKDGRQMGYDYTAKFCSKECGWKGRAWRPGNPDGHVHSTGYIRVSIGKQRKAYKHRQVMEAMIGRPLLPEESPHHRNGQRADNRPDNLELWSKKQPPGQRVIDKVRFAIEMLRLYPEFARAEGVALVDHAQ